MTEEVGTALLEARTTSHIGKNEILKRLPLRVNLSRISGH